MLGILAQTAQPAPDVPRVVERARAYVVDYERKLSGVVVEETYEQTSRELRPFANPTTLRPPDVQRKLKSDLLLVKPEGAEHWIQFRDVFDVDGRPIRDRSERLVDLFLKPTVGTRSQAERIMTESSRFNVGPIERNINVPLMALTILLPDNVQRFRFSASRKTDPALMRSPHGALVVVEFEETGRPTLIHGGNDANIPAQGRFWIEADTGRVLVTELTVDVAGVSATIDVAYGEAPNMDLLAPIEMRELYQQPGRGVRMNGIATYGHFRQFQVSVDEQLMPLKK